MKALQLIAIVVITALTLSSCKKVASIEVINQNNCNYNFFKGGSASGEYLGLVNANSSATFEIDLERGLFSDVFEESQEFFADPANCFGYSSEIFYVELEKRSTAKVLID